MSLKGIECHLHIKISSPLASWYQEYKCVVLENIHTSNIQRNSRRVGGYTVEMVGPDVLWFNMDSSIVFYLEKMFFFLQSTFKAKKCKECYIVRKWLPIVVSHLVDWKELVTSLVSEFVILAYLCPFVITCSSAVQLAFVMSVLVIVFTIKVAYRINIANEYMKDHIQLYLNKKKNMNLWFISAVIHTTY